MSMPASDQLSASERAYQMIRTGILEHTFEAGAMLGEAALAAELGVSRTPVRVALARLQDDGWIIVYPKRGAQVRGVSAREAAELAEARLVLEASAVYRADSQSRRRLAETLQEALGQQRAALADGDVGRFVDLTVRFHRSFVGVARNEVLLELYDRLADRHRYLLFGSGERLLARCADIIAEHTRLLQKLRDDDAAGFAAQLRGHIMDSGTAPGELAVVSDVFDKASS